VRFPGLLTSARWLTAIEFAKTLGKGSKAWKEYAWERLGSVIA